MGCVMKWCLDLDKVVKFYLVLKKSGVEFDMKSMIGFEGDDVSDGEVRVIWCGV